eukprot:13114987-Alexandrium_andersonii.AAC.1
MARQVSVGGCTQHVLAHGPPKRKAERRSHFPLPGPLVLGATARSLSEPGRSGERVRRRRGRG